MNDATANTDAVRARIDAETARIQGRIDTANARIARLAALATDHLTDAAAHPNRSTRGHAAHHAAQAATLTARLAAAIGERDALMNELVHLTNRALTLPA